MLSSKEIQPARCYATNVFTRISTCPACLGAWAHGQPTNGHGPLVTDIRHAAKDTSDPAIQELGSSASSGQGICVSKAVGHEDIAPSGALVVSDVRGTGLWRLSSCDCRQTRHR